MVILSDWVGLMYLLYQHVAKWMEWMMAFSKILLTFALD